MPAGGKTGTTDDQNDRWFAGFTPYYVGVVWYGYDQPKSLEFLSYHPCMPVWKKVMDAINKNLPAKDFEIPSTIEEAKVCSVTGKLATTNCTTITEYFKAGKGPTAYCPGHGATPTPTPSGEPNENPEAPEGPESPTATPSGNGGTPTHTPTPPPTNTTIPIPSNSPVTIPPTHTPSTPKPNDVIVIN